MTDTSNQTLEEQRLIAAEKRQYALAFAICGGEDAPGLLDSVPTGQLVSDLARERSMQRDIEHALRAELDAMTAYALAATKALTGLTPNGSEFFGPELGGIYTANIDLCESVVREGRQLAHERWLKATAELAEAKAEVERKNEALKPFADTVFNDNGDITVSDTHLLNADDFVRAYFALKGSSK